MPRLTDRIFSVIGIHLPILLTTIVLLFPVLIGQDSFFLIGDNAHLAYPSINKLCVSLHHGYFPLWDANCFGGRNFVGGIQTGLFYPPNIIWCYLFGTSAGIDVYYVDLLVIVHYYIAMVGMYRLARLFQMPAIAAFGAALIFSFSGALGARSGCETYIFYGLTLLPWSIYFVSKYYWDKPRKIYFVYAGLLGGLQIVAGHVQPFFHTVFIAAIIIIFYEYRRRKGWLSMIRAILIPMVLIFVFACLLSFPQLYYAIEYLPLSIREVSSRFYLEPTKMVPLEVFVYEYALTPASYENFISQKFAFPNDWNFLYMGILPLFLCIYFLAKKKLIKVSQQHSELTIILIIIGLIGIVSTLGFITFFPYLLYALPFVNGVRELSRYVIMISFSDALFLGLALTYLKELGERLRERASSLSYYLLFLLALNSIYWILIQQKNIPLELSLPSLLAFAFFFILMEIRVTNYAKILAIAFIFVDMFLNTVNYGPTQSILYPAKYYARNRIFDFLETTYGKYRTTFDMGNTAMIRRNLGDMYNIQTKGGYDATLNKDYYRFIYNPNTYNYIYTSDNPEVDDLLNLKYIITDRPLGSGFIFKDSVNGLQLYERLTYYPRCYWKHQLGLSGSAIEKENKDHIQQLAYSDLYQKWSVDCASADTLIFSENMYPGWKCYDGGKEIPIYEPTIKNYPRLFRSIILTKGQHTIEFKYKKAFYWF